MEGTLKILSPLVSDEFKDKSFEELAVLYQATPDSRILATSFFKIYKMAITVSEKYYGLDEDDLASWCLEKLDTSLRTYTPGKSKFITYFSKVYSNKLREETERINYKKRKGILECIDDLVNIGIEDTYNFISLILPNDLTQKERQYCLLASEPENYSNADIAEMMGVTRATICNIRKSLKVKCATLQN